MTEREAQEINIMREAARIPERVQANGIPSAVESMQNPQAAADWDALQRARQETPGRFQSQQGQPNDLVAALRAELAAKDKLISAMRAGQSSPTASGMRHRPAVTLDALRRTMNRSQINNLTPEEVASTVGLPDVPAREEWEQIFGRSSNSVDAARLKARNPERYAQLREFGIIRNFGEYERRP